jgi:uncharacterized protein (TIGR02145 family)
MFLLSCDKNNSSGKTITLPNVETQDVINASYTTATIGGKIIEDGGAYIEERGLCWNTTGKPTLTDSISKSGMGKGSFSKDLLYLKPASTYYVRAYAKNKAGTAYGNEVTFNTSVMQLPKVRTFSPIFKSSSTILAGGSFTLSQPDVIAQEYGVCMSTSPDPTIESTLLKYEPYVYVTSYWIEIKGLIVGNTYYIRAYAINEAGVAYGNNIKIAMTNETGPVTDYDGNTYQVVRIGDQVWMADNLRTTHFCDGTALKNVTNGYWDQSVPVYGWYNNDSASYNQPYGCLYNFESTIRIRGLNICPVGWHVADEKDWTKLIDYLGGEDVAGGKLKEAGTTHWQNPNSGATNETGFNGLPGGMTDFNNGFSSLGITGYYWSAGDINEIADPKVFIHALSSENSKVVTIESSKIHGNSVRCIRDY